MSLERQDHDKNNPWWGEHIHRYAVAIKQINSHSTILDLACGNGFGSHLLSQKTSETVVGGDISQETIDYCKRTFLSPANLKFQQLDGTNTGYNANYFDVIVSFETIEHTTQYKEMLREFYRIAKKGGTIILSTPNKIVSSPDGIVKNPYHTQEFTYEELLGILKTVFDEVNLYGQKYIRYEKKTITNRIGHFVESILYRKGVRKLPLFIQDMIMKCIIGKQMYPLPTDYDLTAEKDDILKCKTFFAICKKNE